MKKSGSGGFGWRQKFPAPEFKDIQVDPAGNREQRRAEAKANRAAARSANTKKRNRKKKK